MPIMRECRILNSRALVPDVCLQSDLVDGRENEIYHAHNQSTTPLAQCGGVDLVKCISRVETQSRQLILLV